MTTLAAPLPDLSRLRFLCRRGMKELDVLFTRWLERRYPAASPDERWIFVRLLEREDPELWSWIVGQTEPPIDVADVITQLRANA
jgi:antitoxin CptB